MPLIVEVVRFCDECVMINVYGQVGARVKLITRVLFISIDVCPRCFIIIIIIHAARFASQTCTLTRTQKTKGSARNPMYLFL